MRLVLTGGGTGGHIYPAIAIAQAFAAEPAFAPLEVLFVGTRDRLEARIVPKAGLPIDFVRAGPLSRTPSFALATTVFDNVVGFVQALGILRRARPDVLIATGGYVAFPVVAALRAVRALGRSNAKIALLETNAVAGLTNRVLRPLADEVWHALPPRAGSATHKDLVVGTPVRAALRRPMDRAEARRALGAGEHKLTIVVMGGSQGARSLNDAIANLATAGFPSDWQIAILSGEGEYAMLRARIGERPDVMVLPYLDDPCAAYAAADIVVARAGASTLGELAATATPALLVPYPHATADHQTENARAFAAGGAARVLPDVELGATRLRSELEAMLVPEALSAMRTCAAATARQDAVAAIVARVKRWYPAAVTA